jgi:hypothetical protein
VRSLLESSLALSVLSGLVVWFYWAVLFPCLALKSRFQIQQISDEAYIAHREGRISSVSFIELQYFLNLGQRMIHHYDMLWLVPKRRPPASELEDLEKRMTALDKDTPAVRHAFVSVTRWMLALYLASNPMELLKLSFLVIYANFSDWADSEKEREKKEVYTLASGLPA